MLSAMALDSGAGLVHTMSHEHRYQIIPYVGDTDAPR
jgi:hypothetical protein